MIVDIPLMSWHYCFVCLGPQSAIENQCLRPCGFSEACDQSPSWSPGHRPLWAIGTFTPWPQCFLQAWARPGRALLRIFHTWAHPLLWQSWKDAPVAKREWSQLMGSEMESPWFHLFVKVVLHWLFLVTHKKRSCLYLLELVWVGFLPLFTREYVVCLESFSLPLQLTKFYSSHRLSSSIFSSSKSLFLTVRLNWVAFFFS